MSGARHQDEEAARLTREVTARAIRRLDILEWVILAGAALLAGVGGWWVALVASAGIGLPFGPVWVVASILLFGVPGLLTVRKVRREDRERERRKRANGDG